jgi:F0F1-type ATP synthase membrane subunit b/b'
MVLDLMERMERMRRELEEEISEREKEMEREIERLRRQVSAAAGD